jgi:(R,R)-butanediol dehydrogenase / meso-butanediol dehydrogenase / diacetyl reductase
VKAVRLHAAGDLRVEDVDAPGTPPPGWVRVDVEAAGICGSDIHNFRTGQWISRAPSVAGHEFAGIVAALGEGVEGLSTGDRVVADSRFWCGECRACRGARPNVCERLGFVGEVCDGGFAEQTLLPARLLQRHAPEVDPAVAAMAEPLAVALHAVRRLRAEPSEPVLVLGCGPIGGLAALVLAHEGGRKVLVSDRSAERAALVADVTGATAVDAEGQALSAALAGQELRYAIDATGSVAALETAIGLLSGGGTLALVGISHGRLDLDPNILVEREIALVGCHAFAGELAEAVAILPALAPAMQRMIGDVVTLDDVPDAYGRLIEGRAMGLKTIIRVGKERP